jgi:hypothetical protein
MDSEALTLEHLDRWALSGAHWRVVDITNQCVVVDLCACTGEPVGRRQSDERSCDASDTDQGALGVR